MPGIRTEVTEIVTGLGTLGIATLDEAAWRLPLELTNVEDSHWRRLHAALGDPVYADAVASAWENGRAFLQARDGLRGRLPLTVEWKGPHRPPGYDSLPADLRIDHVYLVSCKYLSKILANPSPAHLFERALAVRGSRSASDWFMSVAEDAYRVFYDEVRRTLESSAALPRDPSELTARDRERIKEACARRWPGALEAAYVEFSAEVSRRSADVWNRALPTLQDRELLLWRMLRLESAPYFILGSSGSSSLRLRVATPWDWRRAFELKDFEIVPETSAQPRIAWSAKVTRRSDAATLSVEGHVEIRWSHGRFCGSPEAKVYLDTPHEDVPGYFALV